MNDKVPVGALVRFEANHSAGPARIMRATPQSDRVQVQFLWSNDYSGLDLSLSQLRRITLPTGSRVTCKSHNGSVGRIAGPAPSTRQGLQGYSVAIDQRVELVDEAAVEPIRPDSKDPLQLLESLSWGRVSDFALRWRMRQQIGLWYEESEGLPSLVGARIRPVAHQIYAARRVLFDRVPRFVLADEVGLGKTIEAGLILQTLTTEKPNLRVLVIAPGSMSRQWQCELYLRFGARAFSHLDHVGWRRRTVAQREALTREQRLIVSTTVLQYASSARDLLLAREWDIVVVDEAHQFPPGTPLFDLFHALAKTSPGFLALSATPSKREITSLTGLLSLVAPDAYDPTDKTKLEKRVSAQRQVWDLLSLTARTIAAAEREEGGLGPDILNFLADEWASLLAEDPVIAGLVAEMRRGQSDAAMQLVAYVQEFHRIDHRIIRTRRATVQAEQRQWADRRAEILHYTSGAAEAAFVNHLDELDAGEVENTSILRGLLYRLALGTAEEAVARLEARREAIDTGSKLENDISDVLLADAGPGEEYAAIDEIYAAAAPLPGEQDWLQVAVGLAREWRQESKVSARLSAAIAWTLDHLDADRGRQVLVFSQSISTIIAFSRAIAERLGEKAVDVFHAGRPDEDLSRVALRFQKDPACRVLVCDELGGEGRNFQNASAVLHLDLPWSVGRVEQRIGRLDRVGRDRDRPILSIVMCGPGMVEQQLCAIHERVFGVFKQSIGGLEYELPGLQRRIINAACTGHSALHIEEEKLADDVRKIRAEVDEAFDLALDTTKPHLERAAELARLLVSSESAGVDAVMGLWGARLGVRSHRFDDGHWEFKWAENQLLRPVDGLNPDGGFYSGTFSRRIALRSENLNYFAPGHRLVDVFIESFLAAADGRVTVVKIPLGQNAPKRIFLVALATCELGDETIRASLPPGLRSRARRFRWPEVVPYAVALRLGHPGWEPIADPKLRATLRNLETYKQAVEIDALSAFKTQDTTPFWDAARAGAAAALAAIRLERQALSDEASAEFSRDVAAELGFLHWRKRNATTQEAEIISEEIELRQKLADAIRNETIRLDAVALVMGA